MLAAASALPVATTVSYTHLDQVIGCEGPVTNGNYVWIETGNWPEWEKKLIYGPYIHHLVGVHGCYADVLKESCKYIGHLNHDSVNEINSL